MFERGVLSDDRKRRIPVVMTMTDGTQARGAISSSHSDLGELLAEGHAFLEIADAKGGTTYLSKRTISQIALDRIPEADQLKQRLRSLPADNPYVVLGVDPDADEAHCAQAYYKLTKAYHPDRLATLNLPEEVVEYGATMQRRINLAYEEIKKTFRQPQAEQPGVSSETLYERRPHWVKDEAA